MVITHITSFWNPIHKFLKFLTVLMNSSATRGTADFCSVMVRRSFLVSLLAAKSVTLSLKVLVSPFPALPTAEKMKNCSRMIGTKFLDRFVTRGLASVNDAAFIVSCTEFLCLAVFGCYARVLGRGGFRDRVDDDL